jgi:hypothetical protein
MATKYRTTPLGIVELTRQAFDHLAQQGRIEIDTTGTPLVDISSPGQAPQWVVCQIIPACVCLRDHTLRDVCPLHGRDA